MNKAVYRLISVILSTAMILGSFFSAGALSTSVASTSRNEGTFTVSAPKTIYVNSNGSDFNSGSASSPFKTLAKGVSVLAAGDTLNVTGTFYLPLVVTKSGTASAPINIIGSAAILNMNRVQENGIKILGNYINISGFEVMGATSHGVLIGGTNIKVENSSVHHSVTENGADGSCGLMGSSGWGSALKVMVGAEDVILRGNTIYENCGEGIGVTRGVNVLVENNTVRDNFGVNIYMDNSPYTTTQNNTVICTGIYLRDGRRPSGIAMAEEYYSGWGAQRHDNHVLNNKVDGCFDGIASWQPDFADGKLVNAVLSGNTVINGTRRSIALYSANENVLVENNSVYAAVYVVNSSGVTLTNNVLVGSTSTPAIFGDVPASYWAGSFIERLYNAGITGGCSTVPLNYCPEAAVTRAQMAIFILRGVHGSTYTPPKATGTVFSDVPLGSFADAWIEQLALEGITTGCGSGTYCPNQTVTRAQMAVFLLRGMHGSTYTPPKATGTVFSDVPFGAFADAWIEQLALEGITTGCGSGKYCPDNSVKRADMAVFLVRTFNLP